MKRYLFIVIGITIIFLTYGCTNSDEVAEELIAYHNNDWLTYKSMNDEKLGPMETEFFRLATGKDLQGTEALIKEEILPTLGELVDDLEGIKLEHKEVKELNQLKIEIQKEIYKGFKELATMIAEMDRQELEESADILYEYEDKLNKMTESFNNERAELMEKHDIYWIKEYEEDGERIDKMKRKKDD